MGGGVSLRPGVQREKGVRGELAWPTPCQRNRGRAGETRRGGGLGGGQGTEGRSDGQTEDGRRLLYERRLSKDQTAWAAVTTTGDNTASSSAVFHSHPQRKKPDARNASGPLLPPPPRARTRSLAGRYSKKISPLLPAEKNKCHGSVVTRGALPHAAKVPANRGRRR